MSTHTIVRTKYRTTAGLAAEIRQRVSDFYTIEVTDPDDVPLYFVEAAHGTDTGATAYWLRDRKGRTVGTFADAEALVRYADALPRPARCEVPF